MKEKVKRIVSLALAFLMSIGCIHSYPIVSALENDYEVYPNPHMMDYQDGSFDMTSTVNVVYEDGIDKYTKDRMNEVLAIKNIKASTSEEVKELLPYNSSFSAAFNLGIQNFRVYNELEERIKKFGIPYTAYKMLGRHDITLYNEHADLFWLLAMQSMIDSFCQTRPKDPDAVALNSKSVIFNCETYIRIPINSESYDDIEPKGETEYKAAIDGITQIIDSLNFLNDEHMGPLSLIHI